jgi:hypothetical protein
VIVIVPPVYLLKVIFIIKDKSLPFAKFAVTKDT